MSTDAQHKVINLINKSSTPLESENSYANLIEQIADSRYVLIGEASHGTEEFYQTRINITKELILKKNFMAVVIEGDWPDVHRIHRFIQGDKDISSSVDALKEFTRFPTWMWKNSTMPPFLDWLKKYNDALDSKSEKIGFFGLDLYSLNASIEAVLNYLKKTDPLEAEKAQMRYACFNDLRLDPQTYGYLVSERRKKSCMSEVINQLFEIQHNAFKYIKDSESEDQHFFATQNARVVKNAENYYRTMFEGNVESWNVRDEHMSETINVISDYLEHKFNKPAKLIIWAHNSHLGDARATEMRERGELNLGQLVKEQHSKAFSIGFSSYDGYVLAANNWDELPEQKKVNPALKGSFEELFHECKYKNFILPLKGNYELEHYLKLPRLQRAIGVIYKPETERYSHYFFTCLPYQFDSIIHLDNTSALKPLATDH